MFSKIASITLPTFTLVLIGFLYSRRVKLDEDARKSSFHLTSALKLQGLEQ
jgi:predicted permease